jgi:hypothetical protein
MDAIRTSKHGPADLGLVGLGLTKNITEHYRTFQQETEWEEEGRGSEEEHSA